MAVSKDWNYKEIPEFYDRVRVVLDLSSASLPNKYIDMAEKAPFAEAYAKGRVQKWQELDENKLAIFESAIVYKTASFFEGLTSSNSIKKKQLPTITLEYFQNTQQPKIDGRSFSELADSLLSELVDEGTGFIGFMVTV